MLDQRIVDADPMLSQYWFNVYFLLEINNIISGGRILCLEGSVISFISQPSGGSPGPVYHICAQRLPKTPLLKKDNCSPSVFILLILMR